MKMKKIRESSGMSLLGMAGTSQIDASSHVYCNKDRYKKNRGSKKEE